MWLCTVVLFGCIVGISTMLDSQVEMLMCRYCVLCCKICVANAVSGCRAIVCIGSFTECQCSILMMCDGRVFCRVVLSHSILLIQKGVLHTVSLLSTERRKSFVSLLSRSILCHAAIGQAANCVTISSRPYDHAQNGLSLQHGRHSTSSSVLARDQASV
jgi:hypothetical protein